MKQQIKAVGAKIEQFNSRINQYQENPMGAKIKRFNSRINQYQQYGMFVNNPGQFFQQLNNEEENRQCEIPNSVEAQPIWKGIWKKGRKITRALNI